MGKFDGSDRGRRTVVTLHGQPPTGAMSALDAFLRAYSEAGFDPVLQADPGYRVGPDEQKFLVHVADDKDAEEYAAELAAVTHLADDGVGPVAERAALCGADTGTRVRANSSDENVSCWSCKSKRKQAREKAEAEAAEAATA